MLLTRWLRYVILNGPRLGGVRKGEILDHLIEPSHGRVLLDIAKAATGALKFFSIVHSNGVWLSRDLAKDLGDSACMFCEAYSGLANACYDLQLFRFSLVPSLHYMHHFYIEVKRHFADGRVMYVSSPAISNCEADEYYIGKIAPLSRHVHPVVTNDRTIDRFLVKMHFVMEEGA